MPVRAALHPDGRPPAQLAAGRWFLLAVAMISLLAVHFLSAHDSAGDHRMLPSTSVAAGTALSGDPSAVSGAGVHSSTAPADAPAGDGHAFLADCLVLLAAAATAVLVLLRRPAVHRPPATPATRSGGLRGPPRSPSRQALCVERI